MLRNSDREAFLRDAFGLSAVDCAIDWIRDNLEPEDVFTASMLETWAERNGWRMPE